MNERKNKKAPKRTVLPAVFPQTTSCFTVAIVGGGASGIAAACAIASCALTRAIPMRVVVVEKGRRIGSSILRSGNGRCNFSHASIQPDAFNQPSFVDAAFKSLEHAFAWWDDVSADEARQNSTSVHVDASAWDRAAALFTPTARCNAVLRWFFELGLVWQEAPHTGGLLYPFSNKATSVLEVLQAEFDRCGVERSCGIEVTQIEKAGGRFSLHLQDAFDAARSDRFVADAVVIAAGGSANADMLCTSGLFDDAAFVPSRFVLGPLRTETRFLEGLDGIRVRARLSCVVRSFSEEGEVLFREYGISGIVVFNASRFVEAGDVVALDLAPDLTIAQLEEILRARMSAHAARTGSAPSYRALLEGFFLPEVARSLVGYSASLSPEIGIALDHIVRDEGLVHLAACIKHFELMVVGQGDEKQCQVCRGGLRVDAVDPETMEAAAMPRLFVTGEALDVDGPCGGYNLHWAWASGLLAGLSLVRDLLASSTRSQEGERDQV